MQDFHFHFGIHSNIPECCARYYQEQVDAGIKNIALTCRPDYLDIDKYGHIQYVVCNACDEKIKSHNYTANIVHLCHKEPSEACKNFI